MTQNPASIDSPQAFGGLRVLDITGPAGFYCTKLMADLGADVVRVDPPNDDPDHSLGPFLGRETDPNLSLYRWHYHTNKRSILLDIEGPSGRKVFDSLLSAADVLVDTLRPSEAKALGLDSPRLRPEYPGLVHTSITGFGDDGPRADYKATDIVAQAMSGLMALTGFPEDPPNQLGGEQAYQMTSLHAAVGTLVALLARDLDGQSRDVHVAMQECVSMATCQIANFNYYTWQGTVRSRTGLGSSFGDDKDGRQLPGSLYPCKDGWIVYTMNDAPVTWGNFVAWLTSYGAQDDLGEPRLEDPEVRGEEQRRISKVLAAFAAQHTAQELYHSAQRLGLLCTPVQTVADLMEDEQLRDRRYFVEIEHPELGKTFIYPGAPYKLTETPWQLKRRAPSIGEHSLEVLTDWLGVSPDRATQLLDRELRPHD